MLIYLTDPKYPEVCVINNPCSCYIDTCSKKIQSEIVIHWIAQHSKLNWYLWLRKLAKRLLMKEKQGPITEELANRLSQLRYQNWKNNYESSLGCLKRPWGKIAWLSSECYHQFGWHLNSGKLNLKLSHFVFNCSCFKENQFVSAQKRLS